MNYEGTTMRDYPTEDVPVRKYTLAEQVQELQVRLVDTSKQIAELAARLNSQESRISSVENEVGR